MNKKLLAAVVGALFAIPAHAQNSVTISGRINSTFERIKAAGATLGGANDFASRNRMTENSSEIRFSGRESLGGGLTAWFTVGTGLEISFAGNTDPFGRGLIGSRNSGVGLESQSWGTFLLGKWDVHYEAGYVPSVGNVDFGYIDMGLATFASPMLGAGQAGIGIQGGRLNNVVRYVTPHWAVAGGNVKVIAAYARNDENVHNDSGIAVSNGTNKPRQIQLATDYQSGSLNAFYSYYDEKHTGLSGTAAAPAVPANSAALLGTVAGGTVGSLGVGLVSGFRDTRGDRFGASWSFAGLKVGLVYDRLKAELGRGTLTNGGTFAADLRRSTWSIPVSWVSGPHKINAVYARAGELKGSRSSSSAAVTAYDSSDTGAKYLTLGYRYAFSKRTSIYADWAKLENRQRAGYDFFAYAGISATGTTLPAASIGADPQTVQLGIYHTF